MLKRSFATAGWFLATWCVYELVAYFTGWPRAIGPMIAVPIAAFVGIDPFAAIWPRADREPRSSVLPAGLPQRKVA